MGMQIVWMWIKRQDGGIFIIRRNGNCEVSNYIEILRIKI